MWIQFGRMKMKRLGLFTDPNFRFHISLIANIWLLEIFTDPNFRFHILLIASVFAGVDGLPASDFTWDRNSQYCSAGSIVKYLFVCALCLMKSIQDNNWNVFKLTFEGLDVVSSVSEESRSSIDFAWKYFNLKIWILNKFLFTNSSIYLQAIGDRNWELGWL